MRYVVSFLAPKGLAISKTNINMMTPALKERLVQEQEKNRTMIAASNSTTKFVIGIFHVQAHVMTPHVKHVRSVII